LRRSAHDQTDHHPDETNGILPAADLFGGRQRPATGGSNGDSLFGDAGSTACSDAAE
jgi:hypothetical protein